MIYSVTIHGGYDYNVRAADGWDARQVALRQHVSLGRPRGWVIRCSA